MRSSTPFVVVAALAVVLSLGAGAAAALIHRNPQWEAVDATPDDVRSGRVGEGEAVWLRGMRDRDRPLRLASGRTLFPCESLPEVMVDCSENGCAGPLIGRVTREEVAGPLPRGWPLGVQRDVWVVHAGVLGDAGRHRLQLAGALGLGGLLVALGAGAAAVLVRRRRQGITRRP